MWQAIRVQWNPKIHVKVSLVQSTIVSSWLTGSVTIGNTFVSGRRWAGGSMARPTQVAWWFLLPRWFSPNGGHLTTHALMFECACLHFFPPAPSYFQIFQKDLGVFALGRRRMCWVDQWRWRWYGNELLFVVEAGELFSPRRGAELAHSIMFGKEASPSICKTELYLITSIRFMYPLKSGKFCCWIHSLKSYVTIIWVYIVSNTADDITLEVLAIWLWLNVTFNIPF